ncbi:L,D-transpeptidase family protein [Rhodobacter sp. KR11]|jgi:murein L,D-transpeptidase YafK|uniref:L,D-transpeptidase family protein n=1 Tax=Rhodobacter sp. KR11 TaxID=2974588 RepID=UPI0022232B80|nr:L,D-transpeptidase family protein [Rhodobacter sp. KR11]MCW1918858.1 L,D-transpeptidase family protein [Rhodobacter sp. KR11]
MTAILRAILVVLSFVSLTGCLFQGGEKPYSGPAITAIEVHKADRKMYLLAGAEVVKTYDIQLGGNPVGPKQVEGDGKTPEGSYLITHRNPRSSYHLSLGISYPNAAQVAAAKAAGKKPGGDIFIHGQPNRRRSGGGDWTAGCIAVTNREIEEIYRMVNPGTQINIFP